MPDVIAPSPDSAPPLSAVRYPAPAPGEPPAPLLLPVLAGPAAFLWLWVLPIAVLLALNVQGYTLIEGNMDATQRTSALWLGLANVANLVVGVALYFVARTLGQNGASPGAQLLVRALPAIGVQIGYLWLAFAFIDLLPWNVRTWIYPESRYLFNQFSFAMLPLAMGVMHCACMPRRLATGRVVAINLIVAVGAPLFLFLLFQAGRAFDMAEVLPPAVFAAIAIGLGVAMFVALVRGLMIGLRWAHKQGGTWSEQIAIGLVALVFPLGGLLLNRSIEFPVDFQAWEVYALTIANAAILSYASWRAEKTPRLSFALLCATFPFSLYFFIVFLPYTPLSIFAVVAFGAGFLVLTPTLLFALHLHLLNKSRHTLRRAHDFKTLVATGIACVAILPGVIVARATADKLTLRDAIRHVYEPAVTGNDILYGHSRVELRRALTSHRSYKNGIYYPLISDFYAWWVFNNLVLPDAKLARIEETFFGRAGANSSHDLIANRRRDAAHGTSVREQHRAPRAAALPHAVIAQHLNVQSRALEDGSGVVTLSLTLHNPGAVPDEYVKTLPLPAGVFVSGFRLQVEGAMVPGRLFEKKTALWVYSMIRDTERRDPGVLYYNRPNELELRVYPINARQSTVVEFDLLVPEAVAANVLPVTTDAASVIARLGARMAPQTTANSFFAGGGWFDDFRTARGTYLHVLVDRSQDHGYTGNLSATLQQLAQQFPDARQARITLVNHDVIDLVPHLTRIADLADYDFRDWPRHLPLAGSAALDLALAHAIRRHRDFDLDRFTQENAVPAQPIFVVLSRDGPTRTLDLPLTEQWADVLPGLQLCELTAAGKLTTLRDTVTPTPLVRRGHSIRPLPPGQPARFAAGAAATPVELWSPTKLKWQPIADTGHPAETSAWTRAAGLLATYQDYARSPGSAPLSQAELVRASRDSGILNGTTSYIVVENAAQWKMLERTEAQKLSQAAALELHEAPAPPAVYLALAFGGFLAWRRWQRKRQRTALA